MSREFEKYSYMSSQTGQLQLEFISPEQLARLIDVVGGEIYYSDRLLEGTHNMPSDSLRTRRSQYKNKKSENYRHFEKTYEDGGTVCWYAAKTIPQRAFDMFNLPSIEESALNFSKQVQLQVSLSSNKVPDEKAKAMGTILKFVTGALEAALSKARLYDFMFIRKDIQFGPEVRKISERYSIFLTLLDIVKPGKRKILKCAHLVLQTAPFKHLAFPAKLKSFYSIHTRLIERSKEPDGEGLKRFARGKWNVADNARKVNATVIELICFYKAHPNGAISNDKVRIWVNTILIAFPKINGKRILTIRCIDQYIETYKNKIAIYRNGEEEIRKTFAAYLHMERPRLPYDCFYLDEYYIDLKCRASNKVIRKILIGIMDGHSDKMIYCRSVRSLNKEVMIDFFHEVVRLCRHKFSAGLLCDYASYNVCQDIARIFNYLVYKYKSKFSWDISSNANRKTTVEHFWRTYGSYFLSSVVGATGHNMTAERENAHPAKVVTLFINDPAFLEDEAQADRIIYQFIKQYNKNGIHQEMDSPDEIFRNKPHTNALSLDPSDMAFCFGIHRKRSLLRSQVTIDGKDYQLFAETLVNHMGKKMDCYTYVDFPNKVFVFEPDTFEYVGEFIHYEEIPKARVNQTQADIEKLSVMYNMQEAQVQAMLMLKQQGLAKIMKETGGVDPGQFGMFLIDLTLPEKITSVVHLNSSAPEKIEIDLFNLPDRKAAKKARKDKGAKSTISPVGILTDNTQQKYA